MAASVGNSVVHLPKIDNPQSAYVDPSTMGQSASTAAAHHPAAKAPRKSPTYIDPNELAAFFEGQLAQAAEDKEVAMQFAEEQLGRLNGQMVASQRECGRLKARLEQMEENHAAVSRAAAKAVKDLKHERLRRDNMAGQMKSIAKERRALHRQATDTERYTLEQGRRWEERAVDLREELAEAKEHIEQLRGNGEQLPVLEREKDPRYPLVLSIFFRSLDSADSWQIAGLFSLTPAREGRAGGPGDHNRGDQGAWGAT